MLSGRLGLDGADINHRDRHAFVSLSMGALTVEDGTMLFTNAMERLHIPYQMLSAILLGPGSTVSHDAMRLAGRHGLAVVFTGTDGSRCYTAPPLMADSSDLARRQVRVWHNEEARAAIIRWQFHHRFGSNTSFKTVEEARGMEGARIKAAYILWAKQFGIRWNGRNSGRLEGQGNADGPNLALNHAAAAVTACAAIAVSCTATIPQLGFLHEDSGQSFILDVADLYRTKVTIPCAFRGYSQSLKDGVLERIVRRLTAQEIAKQKLIDAMIKDIEAMLSCC